MSEIKHIAQEIAESPQSLETRINFHVGLFKNAILGQPLQAVMVETIRFLNLGGDPEAEFKLPDGVFFEKKNEIKARDVIEQFHLEYYLTKETHLENN